MKKIVGICISLMLFVSGCAGNTSKEVTLKLAAAASLEYAFKEELIPLFQEKYPNVKIEGIYDASGKLQTQIEEGLDADIFMSAAMKQMNNLDEKGYIAADTKVDLLENKLVLITRKDASTNVTSFETLDQAASIAIGDPASVPVGQYSQTALTNLHIWDTIQPKVSLGSNVTEVLNWVKEGSAEVGIVYATDAAVYDDIRVIAEASNHILNEKIIYPVAMLKNAKDQQAAKDFLEFLSSEPALEIFKRYGFTPNK